MGATGRTDSDPQLIAAAVAGEPLALERLLLNHHHRLAAMIARKLPGDLRGVVSPDDVLQETFVDVFRSIDKFRPRGPDSFFHWLVTIAEHRLIDLIRAHRAAKRGGGDAPADPYAEAWAGSLINLLREVGFDNHTPSQSAAMREAVAAVQVALAGLKDEFREAIRLRYGQGLSVAETAERMNRTKASVHMLCTRGLQALHKELGRTSQYLSH